MRKIKFRAWDVEKSQMSYFPMTRYNGEFVDLNEQIKCFQKQGVAKILMQFTGLKDKNGKEIYCGDIVKHEKYDYPFEVKFDYGCFVLATGAMNKHHFCEDNTDKKVEVIGNVYEHSHLLKSNEGDIM